jgi:cytochrome c oxidase subunit 2
MIERYVEIASTYGGDIDALIILIAALVGFWLILCEGVLLYLIIKFRAKPGIRSEYITGEEAHQKRWISIPHYLVLVCDIVIIVGAVNIWYNVKQKLPEPDYTIRIIGQQWAWSFVHPGADGELDTADDIKAVDELHVEKDKVYHFKLEARDVMHSFSVPVFRLKQDAIPGRIITGWFEATKTGAYDIHCAKICGIGHGMMAGKIIIQSNDDHKKWVAMNSPAGTSQLTSTVAAAPAAEN